MKLAAWFRDAPVGSKLRFIGLLTSGFALLSFALILTVKDIAEWRGRTVSDLTTAAGMIAVSAAPALLFDDRKAAAETLSTLVANPDVRHAIIYDGSGGEFALYRAEGHPVHPMPRLETGGYLFTVDMLVVARPIRFEGETLGTVYLGADLGGLYADILRSTGLIFLAALGVFAVTVLLFAKLQRAIVGPVLELARAMENVTAGQDYGVRMVPRGKDEVGMLANAFNDMLERIQFRDAELAEYRGRLEAQVAQRTAALREANLLLERELGERKLAEERTRKQQELTTQIIETIPLRVFWKDRALRYLGCNTAFARDAGEASPADLIGRDDFQLGWREQAELYRADDKGVMDADTPKLSFDEPQTTPTGERIWLRTSKVPLHDEAGQVIGVLGTYEDITERKRTEIALQESEERFRLAFQNSAIGMALVGLDGRWLRVNGALCRIVGYGEEELLSRTFQDITHPDDIQADLDHVGRLLAGEIGAYSMEKRYLRKDGQVVWILLSVSLVRDAQGQPLHFVSQIEDITERKRAEGRIRESEARYRGIFEYADDLIYVLRPDGSFASLSPSFERITGWTADEWIGQPFAPILHPDDLPRAMEVFRRTLAGEATALFELRIQKKSGDYFDSELSIAPVTPGGEIAAIGIARDVTERKRAEEQIRQLNAVLEEKVAERTRQLLEAQDELVRKEKLAVLGQVAGSVGHELRNPLGVMSNAVYFLQAVLAGADETTREYLDIIRDEIADADRIVSELLDSVRTKPPRLEAVGAGELIDRTLHKLVVPANVVVNVDVPATLPTVAVDPLQMQQVFRNLISNGMDAMPGGGTLDIRAAQAGQSVVVSVRDGGTGIAPENLSRLFQPLFTTKPRGIGLGLVVVKNLTQANGGRVEVATEPGKGTTFSIVLPVAGGPPAGEV